MSTLSLINEAISHAGEDQRLTELLVRLEKCRITPETEIPPREFLFKLFGIPCFPRGELVALTGKEKSGKTFISSILLTLCQAQEALSMQRNTERTLRAMWYDTEQSEESTQEILVDRILKSIPAEGENPETGNPNPESAKGGLTDWSRQVGKAGAGKRREVNQKPETRNHNPAPVTLPYDVFNVRALSWSERLPLLEIAIAEMRPDLVILDGIRDLVDDINDGVLSQEVVERLMHLASDNNCCIVCVLHQNKSSEDKNLRGWIGTELAYKAFEVYECTKDGNRIFTFAQIRTRKFDILDKMMFTVNEQGLPELCTVEQLIENELKQRNQQTEGRLPLNKRYVMSDVGEELLIDYKSLFEECMPVEGTPYPALALQQAVMSEGGFTSPFFYKKWKDLALRDGIIRQAPKDSSKRVCYFRPPTRPLPPPAPPPPKPTEEDIPF